MELHVLFSDVLLNIDILLCAFESGTHWCGERGVYPKGGVSTFSDSLVCLLMLEEQELKKILPHCKLHGM